MSLFLQYEWFVRFFDEFDVSKNLSLLPNFAFSVALAHFHRQDNEDKADKALQNALIMFPGKFLLDILTTTMFFVREIIWSVYWLETEF